jgi:hypothetical protein
VNTDPVETILAHALIAVDANGHLCACGDRTDRREHLATVALAALQAPPAVARHRKSRAKAVA